jgi:fibrillarin-like pre-rRNA processing protein
MKEVFEGTYLIDDKLATESLTPGKKVYEEKLVDLDGVEFRLWNPNRSKLATGIINGIKKMPIKKGGKVLYLGAATGTTASHVSDITGKTGAVFCVELSPTPVEKLLLVCRERKNMVPVIADANHPEKYAPFLEKVDVVYQDIAQKNQAEILIKNSELYLPKGGFALLAVKSRSIDSAKKAESVISGEIAKLKPYFKIKEVVDIKPFHRDHVLILAEKT